MFFAEDDLTLHITRGDTGELIVRAVDETTEGGETPYIFKAGDVLRLKVYEKKNCENVVLQKDFGVEEETEMVSLALTETDTRIGDTINKPVDYWYEIELNPFTEPQTIVGYDDDGAKVFKLYPEAIDTEVVPPTPEEVGVLDSELSLTSQNAIQNQAVARAITNLKTSVTENEKNINFANNNLVSLNTDVAVLNTRLNKLTALPEGSTSGDAELADIRIGFDDTEYISAGEAVRTQFSGIYNDLMHNFRIGDSFASQSNFNYSNTFNKISYRFEVKRYFHLREILLPIKVTISQKVAKPTPIPTDATLYIRVLLTINNAGNIISKYIDVEYSKDKNGGLLSFKYIENKLIPGETILTISAEKIISPEIFNSSYSTNLRVGTPTSEGYPYETYDNDYLSITNEAYPWLNYNDDFDNATPRTDIPLCMIMQIRDSINNRDVEMNTEISNKLTEVESQVASLSIDLSNKADKTDVQYVINGEKFNNLQEFGDVIAIEFSQALNEKLDISTFNEVIGNLETMIDESGVLNE